MKTRQNVFVIVDAMAIAYKAYFAFINRPLINSRGEATSAIYGFMTQLIKIIEDTRPKYLAIASDSKEKTFRHDLYEGYKSSRAVIFLHSMRRSKWSMVCPRKLIKSLA